MDFASETATTLVAVAHGSRRAAAQDTARELLAVVRLQRPELTVREAYVELAAPSLPDTLASCTGEVAVVPLLLGMGFHIAHDVSTVADFHRPGTPCAPALGPDWLLADALADRLRTAEGVAASHPVVLAAAGSSDPRSAEGAERMAAMLAARLGREVHAAFNSSARPTVVETVERLRAAGHARVSAASYLLWPGRFADEVAACGADVVSAPIGPHPALVDLVLARYDAAVLASPVGV
ncbi:MAG: sirohydrochlorin chelatase [Sporichthyaceae bacterium]